MFSVAVGASIVADLMYSALLASVIVLPDSLIAMPAPASIVTAVLPDVLETMVEVVLVPAPTVRLPSLVTLPSVSVPVIVNVG